MTLYVFVCMSLWVNLYVSICANLKVYLSVNLCQSVYKSLSHSVCQSQEYKMVELSVGVGVKYYPKSLIWRLFITQSTSIHLLN